jgi:hypothetical protein
MHPKTTPDDAAHNAILIVKKEDDCIAGPHNYRIHFWCGLVFGAFLGAWMGWQIFTSRWLIGGTAFVASLAVAYSSGHWGDRAWHWIISRLHWL